MESLDIEFRRIAYLIRELFELENILQKQTKPSFYFDSETIGYPCGLRRRKRST